ncbi:MAG: serine--tRNA ligase [Bacteroidetes bacterium]|nr:MAG: serine--tRNA ligase [Bacteroidota bacterium]REK04944.1 MAG: serine--tRNA ligase [Bacteroidota bacterium]REK36552.1 MAG: serine--tRNA ligase [Bacteroidota bacterium]REK50918.1 MAG: serine--tRNA ligase [Bacteroidota bacterium]
MLQISVIRENPEKIIQKLSVKNFNASEIVSDLLAIDEDRRKIQNELDHILHQQNTMAKEIGDMYKSGKKAEADDLKNKSSALKLTSQSLQTKLDELENRQMEELVKLPNLPSDLVPPGKTPNDNIVVHQEGNLPDMADTALPHWEIASKYDLIDFELGVKLTGAGFPVYKGKGARLQRALINYFLDKATEAGYQEVQPPILVNRDSGFGTGQLPDKDGQMYYVNMDEFYLIPTAEVPVTNIFRDVILKADELPVKMCAYTPCFRREAGSYGKDVRGLNRLHQFDKVEIVQVQAPDKSYEVLDEMVEHVSSLLRSLQLPFRVLRLCGGDMSFASALTYDFEVYSAAQKKWLEVSSVSNFESFQSNRMKLRFRQGNDKPQLAHTLNGSALALPRIVAAMLENNQTDSGVKIPDAIRAYTGFDSI